MYTWLILFPIFWTLSSAADTVTLSQEGKAVAAWMIILGILGGIAVSGSIAGGIFMMMRRRNQNQGGVIVVQ